ncbi:hypothetical protein FKK45_21470 [Enterobacter hormaechei]|uniref:hypothetical protein n=1 Tax=Enterobacter hormaechei TaxID=158836 RepID=UPI00190B18D9|nr:hypothetical protein [Enterobacter hormaechei]MBK2957186.1 hypothetical protein [Enterobacter hormaechei]
MKDFKGTPGPWVASKTDRSIGPLSRDDDQSYGMILPCAWVEFDLDEGIQQANANLIAAAPDLLAALLSIINMDYQPTEDESDKVYLKARAAIRKALGEE